MDRRERDYAPISGLQHLVFCERQCALIHVERQWDDNDLTIEGTALHARADSGEVERRGNVRTLRRVFLRSDRLRLTGYADVIEEHRDLLTKTRIYIPVEYKHGSRHGRLADDVQICAQAIALEEMLSVSIASGAIAYFETKRRREVLFTEELRTATFDAAERFHLMLALQTTPAVRREEARCRRCSLRELCLPKETATGSFSRAQRYLDSLLNDEPEDSYAP